MPALCFPDNSVDAVDASGGAFPSAENRVPRPVGSGAGGNYRGLLDPYTASLLSNEAASGRGADLFAADGAAGADSSMWWLALLAAGVLYLNYDR